MEMLELLWPAAVLLALYAVLGGTLAWLIGLRGLWAVAAAPAFAMTVVGGASLLAGFAGTGWSILPCLILTAVIGVGIHLVRRRGRRGTTSSPSTSRWWTIGAAVAAAVVIGLQIFAVIGQPSAISQTFDNVFHLNAIRYIMETGAASPLELGQMTSPNGGVPFYPSAWHATAAIVAQLSGVGIPAVVNAQTLVIAAVIWPVSAMLLARTLMGKTATVTVAAAIVSTAIPMFPLLPMDYGVLYPFQLALAIVPFTVAATASAFGIGTSAKDLAPGWWGFVALGAIPGAALAHPGGFVAWLAFSVPIVVVFVVRLWRAHRSGRVRAALAVGVLVYLGIGVLLLMVLRPPLPTRGWPTERTPGQAALEVAQVSMFYGTIAVGVAIAVLLGLFWVVKERSEALVVSAALWAIGALLFIVVISLPIGPIRDALTGSWYNNWPRLAAVFGIALVPLATLGIARTVEAIGRLWSRFQPDGRLLRAIAGVVAAALGFVVLPLPAIPAAVAQAQIRFVLDEGSSLISSDEMALLERLPEHVPAGSVIAGNPYTGTALAYAIGGRQVLMPHILVDVSDDAATINDHLADAESMPAVCDAAEALDVRFVLDFGEREVHGGSHPLAGLEDLEESGAVRLVDSQGDARLYEVTACGLG
ncbi:DUF6541 family protein [Microbacterium sp. NPDC090003]|uniref:DUF6541 family protein n=1 Tax=Microbacterium sp. NPDC090003 TaxID=3364203 RepID=UPI00382C189C